MTDTVKVVATNTIVKKITVGTPVPTVAAIEVVSDVGQLKNVTGNATIDGGLLIFNTSINQFEPSILLDKQIIDGGEGF
tara:strand:- start:681 stop:917 length:237 start_codon:yes stop_codon:yes gene_type:complete